MSKRKKAQSGSRSHSSSTQKGEASRPVAGSGPQRLQRVLAAAGLGSRRQCEELILTGRVEVDGRPAELGMRVDPERQEIRVDGVKLKRPPKLYYVLNKPPGVVCTHRDPSRRTRVIDLVQAPARVFPVGRLDRSSEGLILLTNDGEFANLLAHPRYQVEKTYRALVAGRPTREVLDKLLRGVHLAEGVARAKSVRVCKSHKLSTELEIVLCEGKNREVRRMLAKMGHKVMWLKRVAIGPLRLGKLPVGAYRRLSPSEVEQLRNAAHEVRKNTGQPIRQTPRGVNRPSKRPGPPVSESERTGSVIAFDADDTDASL